MKRAAALIMAAEVQALPDAAARACKVFCEGPLLDAVQRSGLYNDSKNFTDMPMREDPEVILEAFAALPQPVPKDKLKAFVEEHFLEAGHEMDILAPADFKDEPPRIMAIRNETLRHFALEINKLWHILGRNQSASVREAPQRHSLIPRRFPQVVPGGRFRETYYWDSYWIVRGLLVSGMPDTARDVVENLLDDVRNFGFVPNGGRIYYLDRSQPPMLTEMVLALAAENWDEDWLRDVLPVLMKEYAFWMDPKNGHRVDLGEKGSLNLFHSNLDTPRPESYKEDIETAEDAEKRLGRDKKELWRALRSGAETGWDFSSRWIRSGDGDLAAIDTAALVPVDLNAVLYRVEKGLASLQRKLGGHVEARKLEKAAAARAKAMDAALWSIEAGSYKDLWLTAVPNNTKVEILGFSKVLALSDFSAPLWAGLHGPLGMATANEMLQRLKISGLIQPGGVATTNVASGQQWDSPNAWPPLQLMLMEGLKALDGEGATLAEHLAQDWVESGLEAYNSSGYMFEKYNCTVSGKGGGGGEYVPQIGFGWTNGVALALLAEHAEILI